MRLMNFLGVKLSGYDPECLPIDSVEGLRQVCKDCLEINILPGAFFLDLSDRVDNIDRAAAWSESTLGFLQGLLRDRAD